MRSSYIIGGAWGFYSQSEVIKYTVVNSDREHARVLAHKSGVLRVCYEAHLDERRRHFRPPQYIERRAREGAAVSETRYARDAGDDALAESEAPRVR